MRDNAAQGIFHFFITDDNFARNKDWEPIFDRLIHLREVEKIKIRLIIQVDTLCHRLPNFIEKAARAGVKRVFIGLENISPDNLVAAKKKQNKITEYRKMLLGVEERRRHHLCGLHPRLPERHAGAHPPRHRGDQEGAAGRPPRVLLPHPPPRLRGPQEAPREGGLDGPRPQQVRPQPRLHRPPADVARPSGRRPTGRPGRPTTPTSTSSGCCAAPPRPRPRSARPCSCSTGSSARSGSRRSTRSRPASCA